MELSTTLVTRYHGVETFWELLRCLHEACTCSRIACLLHWLVIDAANHPSLLDAKGLRGAAIGDAAYAKRISSIKGEAQWSALEEALPPLPAWQVENHRTQRAPASCKSIEVAPVLFQRLQANTTQLT